MSTYMERAMEILQEKGFYVVAYDPGKPLGVNEVQEPWIKMCIDAKKKKLKANPRLWMLDEKQSKVNRKMKSESGKGQRFYYFHCGFQFKEDNPKDPEQIQAILDKRWETLFTWAKMLKIK